MKTSTVVDDYIRQFGGAPNEALESANQRAQGAGVRPLSTATGQLLRWLTTTHGVHSAVEIGASGGTSGLWMLPAMTQKPTLTSIEPDPAAADLAKRAFSSVAAGGSVRSVHSSPAQVLPRLADASYDLVLLATDHLQWPDYLTHLTRLLRPNGIMVCMEAMCEGAVADPAVTDPVVTAVRAFNATVREEPRWTATMFNVDGGLLLARWAAPND